MVSRAQVLPSDLSPIDAALEGEVVQLFVRFAAAFGLPKSYGAIFGYLYASRDPLPLDAITEGLGISKGSASQGLRALRSLRAIQPVYPPNDRRVHYQPELSLRRLAGGILRERLEPDLEETRHRLTRLQEEIAEKPTACRDPEHMQEALERLDGWYRKTRLILPLIRRAVR